MSARDLVIVCITIAVTRWWVWWTNPVYARRTTGPMYGKLIATAYALLFTFIGWGITRVPGPAVIITIAAFIQLYRDLAYYTSKAVAMRIAAQLAGEEPPP